MQDDQGAFQGNLAIAEADGPSRILAPVWHTALLVLLVAAASVGGALSSKHISAHARGSNLPTYLASIALEWVLAGVVFWGLKLRHTTVREVLGESRAGITEWWIDLGVAGIFWIVALTILGILAVLLRPMHLHPESIRDTVARLAPNTPLELLAWTALCASAGICEEFIFRGYLQLQFARMSHQVWLGVIGSALVFGFSHGYEGLSGMLLIVAFGALFSILRLIRGNVRAGIMAHAWHDFFSGLVLYALAHHKLLP